MSNFDINAFLALLHEINPNAEEELSALELDRLIQGYREGATTKESLLGSLQRPAPTVTLYAHLNVDDLEQIVGQLGLSDNEARKFVSAADQPIKLNCSLESDGTIIIERLEDVVELAWGVALD